MSAYNANWSLMTPEIVLMILALVIFTLDFMTGMSRNKPFLGRLSILSLLATTVLVAVFNRETGQIGDMFVVDGFAMVLKIVILLGVAGVIAISMYYVDRHRDVYQGEYYSLLLFATLGAMLMVSSADLITLFVGLELLSISAYCLAGFKKYNGKSTEAAIKYVVLGGTASAFILYGMSFVYGLTGTTSLVDINEAVPTLFADYPYIMTMAIMFMIAGFGFKISVVPFHMWAPDVYEGAPTPVTSFLSVVSKIAGFGIVLRVFFVGFESVYDEWAFIFALLAAITMIVGNMIAIVQRKVKRLMAFSGVAQAGYLLVPVATMVSLDMTMSMITFYAVAYLLMTLGAFAIITLVTEDTEDDALTSFSGLYQRAPYLAIAMTIFLLSLAGLPITAGFFGKFYIFVGAIQAEMLWLAVIMIFTSIVSFFYYFGIMKQMFMRDPKPNDDQTLSVPKPVSAVVTISLVGTIGFGLLANVLTNYFNNLQWFF
ncbi:NADH-quinone oxidoreductase subunit N [Texcoconibacillus texcoconensis]|uniref:NADH-quinone oxidoreductase subunit N n=1 Tax=Texcoconibacillus texcoconensis TaxID=1095777 RepID=A0A840QRV2_9BACI|nr:NADH-quinone oxidoreductase subunit N [Texcoconibacillus texcoconensis]MBB5174058.1 NADH-quinone oxidoreductase subunit N [Texcoconibacillus texcoconensis]